MSKFVYNAYSTVMLTNKYYLLKMPSLHNSVYKKAILTVPRLSKYLIIKSLIINQVILFMMKYMRIIYAIVFYTIRNTEYYLARAIPIETNKNKENVITKIVKVVNKLQAEAKDLREKYAQNNQGEKNFVEKMNFLNYAQFQIKSNSSLKASTLSRYRDTLKDYRSAFIMLKRYDKTIQSNLTALIVKLENTITLFVSIIDHVDVANITVGPRFNKKEIIKETKSFVKHLAKSHKDVEDIMSEGKIICYAIINQLSNFLFHFKKILNKFAPYVPNN